MQNQTGIKIRKYESLEEFKQTLADKDVAHLVNEKDCCRAVLVTLKHLLDTNAKKEQIMEQFMVIAQQVDILDTEIDKRQAAEKETSTLH